MDYALLLKHGKDDQNCRSFDRVDVAKGYAEFECRSCGWVIVLDSKGEEVVKTKRKKAS
jgi:predicted RNA-binding Zn-ribbon protein involved in translation (DUF1610 family)